MLTKGPAKKVTIFLNEDIQHHMTALHESIMTFLMHKGISGATATRAFSGFGSHQVELPVSSLRFATLAQRRDSLWAMFSSIERRVANEKTIPDCRGPCRTTSTAVG